MNIYKYVPLHFVIRHHYSRLSWAFNFSYWRLLRCVTHSRYRPRKSVGISDVGGRLLPYIWGGGMASPCVPRHFNHCWSQLRPRWLLITPHFSVTCSRYVTPSIACSLCDSWAYCNDACTKLCR